MFCRKNTFRIDFAAIPKKPSFAEIHEFITNDLGLKPEEIVRVHCSKHNGCVFVTTIDLATALRVVNEHDGKHVIAVDEKEYNLRITMVDGTVEVKLFDLSIDVTDHHIESFLSTYGDVISVHEELWDKRYPLAGLPSGVRVAKMLVRQNIPSLVIIDGETTIVTYHGQKQTCRHCGEFVHNGITRIGNKKLLVQKLIADQSYAGVAKRVPNSKPSQPKPTASKISAESKTSAPKPSQTKPSTSSEHSLLMPPPSSQDAPARPPPPQDAGARPPLSQEATARQKPSTSSSEVGIKINVSKQLPNADTARKMCSSEEHDTDGSSTSTNSRKLRERPPGKKMRHDSDDSHVESL